MVLVISIEPIFIGFGFEVGFVFVPLRKRIIDKSMVKQIQFSIDNFGSL
jgi:hypothetical protein